MALLREAVGTRSVAELVSALNAADVLNAPVHDYGDYLTAPHVREVGAVAWLEHSGIGRIPMPRLPGFDAATAGDPRYHAPHIGEHGREVLRALGYADDDISGLEDRGVIGSWKQAAMSV
jgi:crotonobetainyl-CoA:carnitine CoA-transferase CaiB-like acyl-CoA transferase